MKKYLVIGNPIEHSLSPKLHNFWLKKYNINATYDKKLIEEKDIKNLILELRSQSIHGINVTVPFKKTVIPYLDDLSDESKLTGSVNTIYMNDNKVIGNNTDSHGFKISLEQFLNTNLEKKTAFILGAGGVVPSILIALSRLKISNIVLSNRTKEKALELKKLFLSYFDNVETIDWGKVPSYFDIIINATSLGLKKKEEIKLDYNEIKDDKFFYDIIYNPSKTEFLKKGEKFGAKISNGKGMFVFQAQASFYLWHKIQPEANQEVFKLLDV